MTFPLDKPCAWRAYALGRQDARIERYRADAGEAVERSREARESADTGNEFVERWLEAEKKHVGTAFERFAIPHAIQRRAERLVGWRKTTIKDEALLAELEEARRRGYEAGRRLADEEDDPA